MRYGFALLVLLTVFGAGVTVGLWADRPVYAQAVEIAPIDDHVPFSDVYGRVLAQCLDGVKTDAEFLAWLRKLPADMVGLVGYVDATGDAQVLTEQMLRPSSQADSACAQGSVNESFPCQP